jgi:hypothetical protein
VSDPWYHLTYNERWQHVASFRDTDADPKERYVHNAAGLAGRATSSYIDSVVLRDRDLAAWTAAASETLDERTYLLQNWRADVVAAATLSGDPIEYTRYSPYGTPSCYVVADVNLSHSARHRQVRGSAAFSVNSVNGRSRTRTCDLGYVTAVTRELEMAQKPLVFEHFLHNGTLISYPLQVVQIQASFASCAGIYHFETGRYPFPCESRQNPSSRVAMWRGRGVAHRPRRP